jgi:hypothetical protein
MWEQLLSLTFDCGSGYGGDLFQVLLQIRLAVARPGQRIMTGFSSSGQGS